MTKKKSHQEILQENGGKTIIDVYECESGATIVASHNMYVDGTRSSRTCTCTCGTKSTSKTCAEGDPVCDCSDPDNPKLSC